MAKAQKRVNITLECRSCKDSGLPGVSRYHTTKNKKTQSGRLELKKYCRFERKHTVHREVR
jgi:large subunit ribosomal protein L33